MEARGSVSNALRRTPLGRKAFIGVAKLGGALGIFPKGAADVVILLDRTANAYIAGGRTGIFTPFVLFSGPQTPLRKLRKTRPNPSFRLCRNPGEARGGGIQYGRAKPILLPAARTRPL